MAASGVFNSRGAHMIARGPMNLLSFLGGEALGENGDDRLNGYFLSFPYLHVFMILMFKATKCEVCNIHTSENIEK